MAPYMPYTRVIASKTALTTMGEQLMTKRIDETTPDGFLSHHISKAHHMTETFKDIHAALASKNNNKNISVSYHFWTISFWNKGIINSVWILGFDWSGSGARCVASSQAAPDGARAQDDQLGSRAHASLARPTQTSHRGPEERSKV